MIILLVCGSWFEIWWLSVRMVVGAGCFGRLAHCFDRFVGNLQTKTKATWVIEPLLRARLIRKPQIFRLIWGIRGTDSVWTGQVAVVSYSTNAKSLNGLNTVEAFGGRNDKVSILDFCSFLCTATFFICTYRLDNTIFEMGIRFSFYCGSAESQ